MRIGFLASQSVSESKQRCLEDLFSDSDCEVVHVFVDDRPGLTFKKKLRKNFKRGRGGYMLIMAWQSFFGRKSNSQSLRIEDYTQKYGLSLSRWKTPIYSEEHLEEMENLNLDILILLGGFGIVRKKIIDIPKLGVLSYHHGNMRTYRGMPPALWEVYNGEKEMGVTVQLLDPGLDSGLPISEVTVPIHPKDDVETAHARASKMGEPLLMEAIQKLKNPDYKPTPLENLGNVYTLPNLREYLVLRWRIFYRRWLSK